MMIDPHCRGIDSRLRWHGLVAGGSVSGVSMVPDDCHQRRMIIDAAEWHARLQRLAEIQRDLRNSATKVMGPNDRCERMSAFVEKPLLSPR
jgi:hypothetical protein